MIGELARSVFEHLCHQQPDRAWVIGGEALPFCARCTGVYGGATLAALILPFARFSPSSRTLYLHGAAMLQMLVLGFNPIYEPAWLRMLSGSLFSLGAVYFLWLPVRARLWPEGAGHRWAYVWTAVAAVGVLQILVRVDVSGMATAVEALALFGIAALVVLALMGALAVFAQIVARGKPA